MITATDLEVRAGARTLLFADGPALRIQPGDRIGLVGRNGAGKTTTLRILAGEGEPYAGTVARTGEIGYLPQDPKEGDLDILARDRVLSARGLDTLLTDLEKQQALMAEVADDAGAPHLIGSKCPQCATYVFPPRANNCPNPGCDGDQLDQVPLSRRGKLWSYTENRYAPPPPYPSPDPFEPFAVAAVELADEGLIVLGKVVDGTLAADLKVGMEMELTTMPLFVDDDGVERTVYAWRIA